MVDIYCRPGTWDQSIWDSVARDNEYDIPALSAEDVCIDLGAHIGAATYRLLDAGAGLVIAVECDPDNQMSWLRNIYGACGATDRAVLIASAVWGAYPVRSVLYHTSVGVNTGGGNVLGTGGRPCRSLLMSSLLTVAYAASSSGRIRLVKMDIEGAEWSLLEDCTCTDVVEELVGEYHTLPADLYWPHPVYDADYLLRTLSSAGYVVTVRPTGDGLGLFHGVRADRVSSMEI